jgi:hypothetical protein
LVERDAGLSSEFLGAAACAHIPKKVKDLKVVPVLPGHSHGHVYARVLACWSDAQKIVVRCRVAAAGVGHHGTIRPTNAVVLRVSPAQNLVAEFADHILGHMTKQSLGAGAPIHDFLVGVYGKGPVVGLKVPPVVNVQAMRAAF